MKLWAMPCRTERSSWRVLTKSGPLEEGMSNHVTILALRMPWNSMKGQKDRTLKDELPRLVGVQYATGDHWRNNFRKNKEMESKQQHHPVVDIWLVMEVKSDAVESNTAQEPGMLGPWIKANWKWSNRRWQEWTSTFLESAN